MPRISLLPGRPRRLSVRRALGARFGNGFRDFRDKLGSNARCDKLDQDFHLSDLQLKAQ